MRDYTVALAGRRVLLTGATGFIGSRLRSRLHRAGAEVHAISRQLAPVNGDGTKWWHGDLTDQHVPGSIVAAVRPDVLFHLASHVTGSRERALILPMIQSNLLSTVHVLEAAGQVGCPVVLAGSMEEPATAEAAEVPCSPYAAAKWAANGYARMFHALYGIPTVTLRIFMVYGPGHQDTNK